MLIFLFFTLILSENVIWAAPVGDNDNNSKGNKECEKFPDTPDIYVESCSNIDFTDLINYISKDSNEAKSPEFDSLKDESSECSPEGFLKGLEDFICEIMTPESAPSSTKSNQERNFPKYSKKCLARKQHVSPQPLDLRVKTKSLFKKPSRLSKYVSKKTKSSISKDDSDTETADESEGERSIHDAVEEFWRY